MSDSNARKLLGVERVPHLGIRHRKFRARWGTDGSWLIQYPTDYARAKFSLPPNKPLDFGANATKRARDERLAHRRRFSGRDRVLPREEP